MNTEYRINLDIYNGPMDLLLYLIRRDEVDVYDIPIASITEQYVKHVEILHQIDPNLAGEFLVMAATLMEIKTRMLLPVAPAEDGSTEGGVGIDPRTELVRQLLEYKAFKDAAADLSNAVSMQNLKFARKPHLPGIDATDVDLEDVQVWDLLDAFSRLLAATGQTARQHEVIYDDTPQELHQADLLDRLQREGRVAFTRLFEGVTRRVEMVGLFLAMLELIRQKKIAAVQDENFGEIFMELKADADDESLAAQESRMIGTIGESADAEKPSEAADTPTETPAPVAADPFADSPAETDAPVEDDLPELALPSDDELALDLPSFDDLGAGDKAKSADAPEDSATTPSEEIHHDAGTETQGTGT